MEPITSSVAPHLVRVNGAASQGELSGVLRDGRVLAGEVLQSPGDGTILVAVGQHRVPAQTNVFLEPGETFLFRVQHLSDTVVLQVLQQGDPQANALVAALRGVIADQRPIGELLQDLAASLRARAGQPDLPPALAELFESLGGHVFSPADGGGGRGLLALLARSGLRYEAALFALAQARRAGAQAGGPAPGEDLKARLLRALAATEDGPEHKALARTLAGLEAEQLLNLARQRSGEPFVWSFPVPDGDGWSTAHLALHGRQGGGRGEGGGEAHDEDDETHRFTLGVRYQSLGPVRADVTLARGRVDVRLAAARKPVWRLLRRQAEELSQRLTTGERVVSVVARWAEASRVLAGVQPVDVRFLREHRLMDVAG